MAGALAAQSLKDFAFRAQPAIHHEDRLHREQLDDALQGSEAVMGGLGVGVGDSYQWSRGQGQTQGQTLDLHFGSRSDPFGSRSITRLTHDRIDGSGLLSLFYSDCNKRHVNQRQ